MARITVEDCLQRENNRFALVLLASKRSKQLLTGSKVLLKEHRSNKAVVTALREIASGVVRFMTTEEKAAQDEARVTAQAEARAENERQNAAGPGPELPKLPTLAVVAEDTTLAPASGEDATTTPASPDSNGTHS